MLTRAMACLVVLCALLFAACYGATGSDERNMRSFHSYPKAVQDAVRRDGRLSGMVAPPRSRVASFLSNLVVFSVALIVVGLVAGVRGFGQRLLVLLLVGEGLNLFDLLVIDLLWWRHSPRVRFSTVGDASLYQDPRPHVAAFWRGVVMFCLAALVASVVLTLVS